MIGWINKKRNQKGFTLIELVVVIAILGILAAIAIPRLSGSRQKAAASADAASVRTVESAISIALAEGELLLNNYKTPATAATGFFKKDGTTAVNSAAGTVTASELGGVLVPNYLAAMPTSKVTDAATIIVTFTSGNFVVSY